VYQISLLGISGQKDEAFREGRGGKRKRRRAHPDLGTLPRTLKKKKGKGTWIPHLLLLKGAGEKGGTHTHLNS